MEIHRRTSEGKIHLQKAVKWKMLVSNPAADVELPRSIRRELNVLTPAQAQKFLKVAYEGKHGVMFHMAVATGLRPEEYLGLKWPDIDFQAKTVTVQRTLVWKRWKTEYYFGELKTSRSRRTIPCRRLLSSLSRLIRERSLKRD